MHLIARFLILFALAVCAQPEQLDIAIGESDAQKVGDKFVSFSVDPEMILGHTFTSSELSALHKIARQVSPAFLQLSGPWCQKYHLEPYASANRSSPVVSGEMVQILAQTAQQAGLTLVVCLNPTLRNADGTWNSAEAREILEILHMMELDIAVQLGHKRLENEREVSGWQMGVDLVALSNLLQEFPRFRSAPIFSPEVTPSLKLKDKLKFDQIFRTADTKIDNVIWQPRNYTSAISPDSDYIGTSIDSALQERSLERWEAFNDLSMLKAAKKPLWISDAENLKVRFVDAMLSVSRLGHAAKSDVDVVLQKPNLRSLCRPTPAFWASALHKRLVGQTVLDVSFADSEIGHETHLFAHCSPEGGITLFGANYRLQPVSLKVTNVVMDSEIHVYSLTPRKRNIYSRTVFLNKHRPNVSSEWMQPLVLAAQNDEIAKLHMPATSIVFWHMPNVRIDACVTTRQAEESKEIWTRDTGLSLNDKEKLLEETAMVQNCTAHEPSYSVFLRRFMRFLNYENQTEESNRTKRAAPIGTKINNRALSRNNEPTPQIKQKAGARYLNRARMFSRRLGQRRGFVARSGAKSVPKRMVHHWSKNQKYADSWSKVTPLRNGHRIIGRKRLSLDSDQSTEKSAKRGISKESEVDFTAGRVKRQMEKWNNFGIQRLEYKIETEKPYLLTEPEKVKKSNSLAKFLWTVNNILSSVRQVISSPHTNDAKNN